jgi:multidrug efflux pump subunit AcrB
VREDRLQLATQQRERLCGEGGQHRRQSRGHVARFREGAQHVARVDVADGPPTIKSENARPSGWVYVDIRGRDLVAVVRDAQRAVIEGVTLPPGYSIAWSGQLILTNQELKIG